MADPKILGAYSMAFWAGELLFCSGQIGADESGVLVDDVKIQAKNALKNLQKVLKNHNLSTKNVVKTTIFLRDMSDFEVVNEIYSQFFSPPFPARSTICVAGLPKNALIEIECVAKK